MVTEFTQKRQPVKSFLNIPQKQPLQLKPRKKPPLLPQNSTQKPQPHSTQKSVKAELTSERPTSEITTKLTENTSSKLTPEMTTEISKVHRSTNRIDW